MASHLEASLHHDIGQIQQQVRVMAGQCDRAVQDAVRALVSGERQPAYLVILRDRHIDESEQQLDRLALEFLVRHQPAAGHLRFAYAALKISSELERIGDHAEAIARRLLKLEPTRPAVSYAPFEEMGNASRGMLRDAVRAFTEQNAELARRTMGVEQVVDRMRRTLDADLARMQRAGQLELEPYALLTTINRRLERVSDETWDVCAETLYMCTGEFVKHRTRAVFRVLFVDQHNHCRSQMAEAIGNAMGLPRMLFTSAGLEPRPIDPRLPAFLAEKGIDFAYHRPKELDQVSNLQGYQVAIAFDEAAYYALAVHRGPIVCIDWPVEDPSVAEGTPEEVHAAYERTFAFIETQLRDLMGAVASHE